MSMYSGRRRQLYADRTAERSRILLLLLLLMMIDDSDADNVVVCTGLLLRATSLDDVAVNGTLVRFAQRHEHHDSKQPLLVVFTEQNRLNALHAGNNTGLCTVLMITTARSTDSLVCCYIRPWLHVK